LLVLVFFPLLLPTVFAATVPSLKCGSRPAPFFAQIEPAVAAVFRTLFLSEEQHRQVYF
jgi:hypothetical protein